MEKSVLKADTHFNVYYYLLRDACWISNQSLRGHSHDDDTVTF